MGLAGAARPLTTPRRDWAAAVALAALLTLVWALRDWANLSALRLPDSDDAVRLQQVRDWLGGQAFADVTQYRLGADAGLAMHWSRLPDLIPAGLIAALAPLLGQPGAELAAVLLWPATLFALALWLVGRIARAMQAPPITAQLVGALAFPATAWFAPGRIDHHGLQLVLLLALVRALLRPRGVASAVGIAVAGVASFAIGLEMAPYLALACALVVLGWIAGRDGSDRQLSALALALLAALVVARAGFATTAFAWPAADGFTASAWYAALAGAGGLMLLTVGGRWTTTRRARLLLASGVALAAAGAVLWLLPFGLDPYATLDPALRRDWLARVGEAQPLFAAPLATVVGQCGLLVAGLVATGWALLRTRDPGWAILALFQGTAAAITVWQLRGAPAGAMLGVPALALAIAAARRRGAPILVATWLAAAGIVYPLTARALPVRAAPGVPDCTDPASLAALARLPAGRIAGPIDLGAWGLAATRHHFLAAPYHRNGAGNRLAAAITRGAPAAGRADYLAVCGAAPVWLGTRAPVLSHSALHVWRIDRLPAASPPP